MPGRRGGAGERVAAATGAGMLLLTSGAIVATYAARTAAPEPGAARYFADQARWRVHRDGDGNPDWVASSVGAAGLEFVGHLPNQMADSVRALAAANPRAAVWTSVTTARLRDGQHFSIPEVYLAGPDGIVQPIAPSTLPLPLSYEPALRILPAKVERGATWSQHGVASYSGIEVTQYQADAEITEVAEDGCVDVRSTSVLTPTEDGAAFGAASHTETSTTTYCPGRWSTRTQGGSGTTEFADAAAALAAMKTFAAPQANSGIELSDAAGTVFARPSPSPASTDPLLVPQANVLIDSDGAAQVAAGVVADASLIFPVWRVPASAPFVAKPMLAADVAVLADSAGVVTAVEPATGFVRWQQRLGATPRALAADPAGGLVAVLDSGGRVTLLDGATGTRVDRVDGTGSERALLLLAGGVLVTAGPDGYRGVRLGAGAAARKTLFAGADRVLAGPVLLGHDLVLATDSGELVRIGPDGTELARRHLGFRSVDALAGGPGVLALAAAGEVTILDAALTSLAVHPGSAAGLTIDGAGAQITATGTDGRLRVYAADGTQSWSGRATVATTAGPSVQRAAAISHDGITYVSAAIGVERFRQTADD